MTSDNARSGPDDAESWSTSAGADLGVPEVLEGEALEAAIDYSRVRGHAAPRLWTRPLRPLTRETSYGYRVIDWASDHGYPLDPWERWLAVHVGELLPDGRPRFRRVVIIVARQNGKTLFLKILILWWAYEDSQRLILMTSTNLEYARAGWAEACEMAGADVNMPLGVERLEGLPAPAIRQANGQEMMKAPDQVVPGEHREGCRREECEGCRRRPGGLFRIAAAKGSSGGRSLTIDRLVADEVRQHQSWDAYNAGVRAMIAVKTAQAFFVSNQGDHTAVVLHALRAEALDGADTRLGIFEWSAPPGSRPDSVPALCAANPNVGHRLDVEDLLAEARTAMRAGGEALAKFKTEVLCLDVPLMNPAIDLEAWRECAGGGDMSALRRRVVTCLDVSLDGTHATLVAAAVDTDGKVRVEVVRDWDNIGTLLRTLPLTLARVRPRVFAWFPKGPAAAAAAKLAVRKGRRSAAWPPPGVEVREIREDVPAVCMGLDQVVRARGLIHPNDPLLNQGITDAQRQDVGDVWVFTRRDSAGPIDSAYALAGAVHEARQLPPPPRVRRLVVAPE